MFITFNSWLTKTVHFKTFLPYKFLDINGAGFVRKLSLVSPSFSSKMGAQLKFAKHLETSDPRKYPVTIIGQLDNLQRLQFSLVKSKLEPRVTEEVFTSAIESLHPSPTDSCPLYLNSATVVALPKGCSRHNTPSRAHTLTKVVKHAISNVNEYIVIVCERSDVFASACAVARAFPLYSRKTKHQAEKESSTATVEFILVSKCAETQEVKIGTEQLTSDDLQCLEAAAVAIRNTARIVDTPCNEMHTDQFVKEAVLIAEELGITPVIIRGEDLDEKGFGGIYGVGKAAEHPPALVVLSHKPTGATKSIAWVGKGIVYDTGGLSIKSKTAMPSMKRDCGGAAAVLNAFHLAVKQGFQENLHAVLCLAENSVGPKSTRPDDVLTMYSKKTVEVNNTDAEGRLVLGDGVAYAKQDLGAEIIIDMATLTGAQGISTGKHHAAILTNSEEWEVAGMKAGKTCGDLVFPIPFAPELHFSEFNSAIADMKNSVADRGNAQSSCAGLFIMSHLGFEFPGVWVHLDIASPAEMGERATGYGVALLNTLCAKWSSNTLLKGMSPWD